MAVAACFFARPRAASRSRHTATSNEAFDEGLPKLGRASTLRIEVGRQGVALQAARGLFNERVEAGQPPALAEGAYGGHVGVEVVGKEFYDVRTRFCSSGVELERNQVRQRHDPQAASGTDDRLGRCESAFDNRRKPATVVHDLDETEWASHVDNTAERILSVWLSKLNLEARRPQRVTFSPFLDPSGILGFFNLAPPERVVSPDGKEECHRRADCVRIEAS
jgi:hypothetical protein